MSASIEKTDSQLSGPIRVNIWSILIAEMLFVILPLLVTGIVLEYKGQFHTLLDSSEWSFATAILFGQALTKFVSGLVSGKIRLEWQRVILLFTVLIVLGLVPSLMVLTLVLVSESTGLGAMGQGLRLTQMLLFVLGLGGYIVFGGLGEFALARAEELLKVAAGRSSE
ncbi:MAG TPA: hypothetical protein VFC63_08980 [Blastocatellia bacterium]|nr:hypothetical protein [Blastocatellia bacterium]